MFYSYNLNVFYLIKMLSNYKGFNYEYGWGLNLKYLICANKNNLCICLFYKINYKGNVHVYQINNEKIFIPETKILNPFINFNITFKKSNLLLLHIMGEKIKNKYLIISENIFKITKIFLYTNNCFPIYKNGKYILKINNKLFNKIDYHCFENLNVLYIIIKLMGTKILANALQIHCIIEICNEHKINYILIEKNKQTIGIEVFVITKADYIETKYFEGNFYITEKDIKIFTKVGDYVLFI